MVCRWSGTAAVSHHSDTAMVLPLERHGSGQPPQRHGDDAAAGPARRRSVTQWGEACNRRGRRCSAAHCLRQRRGAVMHGGHPRGIAVVQMSRRAGSSWVRSPAGGIVVLPDGHPAESRRCISAAARDRGGLDRQPANRGGPGRQPREIATVQNPPHETVAGQVGRRGITVTQIHDPRNRRGSDPRRAESSRFRSTTPANRGGPGRRSRETAVIQNPTARNRRSSDPPPPRIAAAQVGTPTKPPWFRTPPRGIGAGQVGRVPRNRGALSSAAVVQGNPGKLSVLGAAAASGGRRFAVRCQEFAHRPACGVGTGVLLHRGAAAA